VCFTDLEGRFHMLDYDKKFLLKGGDNLTFDGSSIAGSRSRPVGSSPGGRLAGVLLAAVGHLRARQVLVFGEVRERDGSPYGADMRSRLKAFTEGLLAKDGTIAHASNEIEGFLSRAATLSGSITSRARSSSSRRAATTTAAATRCGGSSTTRPRPARAGFGNEKDHPRWRRRSSR